jgi:hypothetical protein
MTRDRAFGMCELQAQDLSSPLNFQNTGTLYYKMRSLATPSALLLSLLLLLHGTTATPVPEHDTLVISIHSSSSSSSPHITDKTPASPFSRPYPAPDSQTNFHPPAYPSESRGRSSANRNQFHALLDALKAEDCELQPECYDDACHCEESVSVPSFPDTFHPTNHRNMPNECEADVE